ncbi:hypothetical protein M9Y10_022458 [Tritrichomonas musculus]|uniref:Uncharacterized protein n=1 Tax=Tritrichomonas musculus TaxID=1915356 RepID=A0ABR2KSN7_9EUKA
MEVKKQKHINILQVVFVIISFLMIFVGYFSLSFTPQCYFYLNSHFLDRNSLYLASRTWMDQILIKLGIFQIQMISLPNHKVDKLYPHIDSNCTAVYNGKLNLPCIDTEIYHHFINRHPQLNWLYISNTLNHVNFKNLLRYIKLMEQFADPKKHIIFKSHVSDHQISDISGWLVSRAFSQYIVDNNISFEKIAQISEGGFSHSAHTRLLSKMFNSTNYFDNPFMTDKICGNCEIQPLESCPNQDLYRASDFITTGMRFFPKTMHKFSRQMNSFSSTIFLYNVDQKTFNICLNTHLYKYHKLDLNEIRKNTPPLEKIKKPIIEGNENKGFIPKYTDLIMSKYEFYNFNQSNVTRCVIFYLVTVQASSRIQEIVKMVQNMEFYKNRTFDFVFIFGKEGPSANFTMPYVTTPCHEVRDGPYGLSCKNDFLKRVFLDQFKNVPWFFRAADDTFLDLDNFNRYLDKIEKIIDPIKHIVLKFLVTEYFKNIEYSCGGVGWIMSRRLVEFLYQNNVSMVEFSRFSHELQDDTAIAHIAWSLFNSSLYFNEHFIVDMICAECNTLYKEKNDKFIKRCPPNVHVTKASDIMFFHSIGYTPSRVYFFNNRKRFNPNLSLLYIPSKFLFHLCIANEDQLDTIDNFDFKKTTPKISTVNTTRILRPDDYKNYYFATRKLI